MPASKMRDEGEVQRWFAEGRTYQWMVAEYARKYSLVVSVSMFSNYRRKMGLARRIVRDTDLLPWEVAEAHRWDYNAAMLRAEGRRRAGAPLRDSDRDRLPGYVAGLKAAGEVIDYSPTTGFSRVKARPGIDTDLIRVPNRVTSQRLPSDEYSPDA